MFFFTILINLGFYLFWRTERNKITGKNSYENLDRCCPRSLPVDKVENLYSVYPPHIHTMYNLRNVEILLERKSKFHNILSSQNATQKTGSEKV
jgi:hypothetical protein